METCSFCNSFIYNVISPDDDWRITMFKDRWNNHHFLDIEHNVCLEDFGTHEYSTYFLINYCPMRGRKLGD